MFNTHAGWHLFFLCLAFVLVFVSCALLASPSCNVCQRVLVLLFVWVQASQGGLPLEVQKFLQLELKSHGLSELSLVGLASSHPPLNH